VRVVFLTHNYPRRPGDPSGSTLATLARALMRRGISVRVVTPGEGSEPVVVDGVPVSQVRAGRSIRNAISRPESIAAALRSPVGWLGLARLRRALRTAVRHEVSAGADLVHAHGWMPAGLSAPPGTPLVLTVHGTDAPLLKVSRVARWLARPLFQGAAVVTAVSREVATWVQTNTGRFVDSSCIHPMPADTRSHPWTRGGGGLVVISRLIAAKRVELAIETAAVLASYGHDFPLTIVGDGPERASLEQRAARLGVSTLVRFAGALSPSEARTYLERADIMLFTARGDATALSAIEALISGVPVVACWDSGAAVDIVPESGPGRLTLPAPESLADSILDLQGDADRLTMGRLVGESWRARLAPDNVAELCEGWYRNALAG
jgi:glycosyltransferase involved in cell wall biosynthesis